MPSKQSYDVWAASELHKDKKKPQETISLSQLYRYATPFDYLLMTVGVLFGLAQGAFIASNSLIFQHLTDALIEGQILWEIGFFDYPTFELNAIGAIQNYAMFGCGIFAVAFISMSCWHTLAIRQSHRIREEYFGAVLRQNMAWFDCHETGALSTRMSEGMDRIKDGTGDKLGALCSFAAMFVCGMVVAFTLSWKMTLVILAFTPLFFGPIAVCNFLITRITPREQATSSKAGAVAEEVIGGIRTVIAFNGQKKEISRYDALLTSMTVMGVKKAFLTTFGLSFVMLALFLSMGVSFYFGTMLVISKEISPGTTFAVFGAVMGGTFAVSQAAPLLTILSAAKAAATPIFEHPPIDSQSAEGKHLKKIRGDVEFSDIHFTYPSRPDAPILRGVSLRIKAGTHVALVGHSGCGKSTLVGLLLRYYDVDSGTVSIDGIDVALLNVEHLRNVVGVVSQEPALFADSIANNLRRGKPDITDAEMENVCRMANAHDFIMQLPEGYNSRIGDGGVQLSGGQKQRIAIARALARDPKAPPLILLFFLSRLLRLTHSSPLFHPNSSIFLNLHPHPQILLLDEATSALDTESESIVQEALEKAAKGRTIISIAHRLSTIKNADCIYVFDKGAIVEHGTHDELMRTKRRYTLLVEAQAIEKAEKRDKEDEMGQFPPPYSRKASTPSLISSVGSRKGLIRRESKKLSRSISLVSSKVQDDIEELKEEAVAPSSIWSIILYAREEWFMLFIGVLMACIRGCTIPLFSIIYGRMFYSLSNSDDDAKLAGARMNAVWFALIGLLSFISTFLSGFLLGKAGEFLTKRMRIDLFTNIVQQDGEYFDKLEHAPGRLTTRLASDAPNIRAAVDQRLADVLQAVSAVVAAIVIAFTYSPIMAPVGILASGTLVLLQTLVSQYLRRRAEKDAEKAGEPARLATEAIELHKTVAYLTREKHFVDEFKRGMAGPRRRALVRGVIESFTYALFFSYIFFNFSVAYRYGVWLVYVEKASPYIVFQVIEVLNVASMSLIAFATYFPEYVRARLSAGLLFKMLQLKPSIDSLAEGGERTTLSGEIRFNDVSFSYPTRRHHKVLDRLRFVARPGQTVALVGPSGCGKSTVIQLLERFYDPSNGAVTFDSVDHRLMNVAHLRSQISLVEQEPILFNYSIWENIAYGMEGATQDQIEAAAKLANAHNFITSLPAGYDTEVGERGSQMSGGQKQRIAIARAVIMNPKVLLLDEATSALDTESEKVVQEALDQARAGRTCLVIAHRLSSIQNSDVILVCEDGRIVERGSHQELLALDGLYANLVQRQKLD